MRITRLLYGNDVNILLSVPALLFLLKAFNIAFSNPQTLRRVSITNYVTVIFEASSAVHSLQKIGEKREKSRSKTPCVSWTTELYDA